MQGLGSHYSIQLSYTLCLSACFNLDGCRQSPVRQQLCRPRRGRNRPAGAGRRPEPRPLATASADTARGPVGGALGRSRLASAYPPLPGRIDAVRARAVGAPADRRADGGSHRRRGDSRRPQRLSQLADGACGGPACGGTDLMDVHGLVVPAQAVAAGLLSRHRPDLRPFRGHPARLPGRPALHAAGAHRADVSRRRCRTLSPGGRWAARALRGRDRAGCAAGGTGGPLPVGEGARGLSGDGAADRLTDTGGALHRGWREHPVRRR